MKHEVQLGRAEGFSLVTICIITKMFLKFLPASVSKYGPSCWYVSIFSALAAYILYRFSATAKFGFVKMLNVSYGKFFGKITGAVVAAYFLLYTALNLREIIRIIKIYNFPSTPSLLFAVCFMAAAVFVGFYGLHGVGKLAVFYIRIILIALAVIFLLGFGQYDFKNLAPFGGYGIKTAAVGSVFQLTVFSDIFLLLLFLPEAGGSKNALKTGLNSIAVSAAFVILSMAAYICVFDFSVAGDKTSGLIEIVKNAHYGHLFQRMESLFFLVMVISSAVSMCVWFFSVISIYSEVFEIKDKKEILLPTALLIVFLSGGVLNGVLETVGRFGGLFILGLAAVTSFVAKLRRKKAEE